MRKETDFLTLLQERETLETRKKHVVNGLDKTDEEENFVTAKKQLNHIDELLRKLYTTKLIYKEDEE